MTSPAQPHSTTALNNISHVIVLMFENRSFDHLLGAMPGVDGVLDPEGKVYEQLYNTRHPTHPPCDAGPETNPPVRPAAIVPDIGNEHSPNKESTVFKGDAFNHDFSDAMLCDLYGPGTTGIVKGQPQGAPATTYPPTNSGFLIPDGNYHGEPPIAGVMSYFAWNSMQIFHPLARNFVTCDAWHCDMPGHTEPNRAFMHCATTGHLGINDQDHASMDTNWQDSYTVRRKTIYEQIQDQTLPPNKTWKMYWPGSNCDTDWLNSTVFKQRYDKARPTDYNRTLVPLANLFSDLKNHTLPFYSFIMSFYDIGPDWSMHPDAPVEPGENLLACVYNALRASDYWDKTLLIVNFDENGGMYDHKSVPAASPPEADAPVETWQWPPKYHNNTVYSFDYSVLGPRIPVLLISPWLQAGICSDPYQNTSVLRFVQDLLTPAAPGSLFLTQRDRHAPSIAPVFDYANFGLPDMRTDCPENLPLYVSTLSKPAGPEAEITGMSEPTPAQLATPPALHIVEMTKKSLAGLPGHPDSGKPITRAFATVGELRAYAQERRDAAMAEIAKGSAW